MTTLYDQAAFPIPLDDRPGAYPAEAGMSLRDYFAAKAMAASIMTSGAPWMFPDKSCSEQVAKMAYQMADSMLAERS